MATESIREDEEIPTNTAPPAPPISAPWDVVSFEQHDELTPAERKRVEDSRADTEMRREAAIAQAGISTIDAFRRNSPRVVVPLNSGEDASFTVSPSINEHRVLMLTTDESEQAYLQTSVNFLKSTRESLERVSAAYEALRADVTMLPNARSLAVSGVADKAYERAITSLDNAVQTIDKQIAGVDKELRSPLTNAAHVAGMGELRSVLREMKPAERRKALEQAIAADNPTQAQQDLITAALGGHYLMSGLDEKEHELFTLQVNKKCSPHLVRRKEQLEKSLKIVSSVNIPVLQTAYEGAQRASFRKAPNMRALSDKAQAALAAAING